MNVVQVALALGNIRQDTVYRAIQTGRLPAEKEANGRWQVSAADVEAYLARRRSKRASAPNKKGSQVQSGSPRKGIFGNDYATTPASENQGKSSLPQEKLLPRL